VKDIPLDANVECTDGLSGRSTYVIVNPIAQQVTHFVVKEKKRPHTERLVSLDKIEETTPNLIRLRCTKNELAKMDPFVETHYIPAERPHYEETLFMWPNAVSTIKKMVTVKYRRIPPGELAVHRGTHVMANDGHVGRVDEFLVEPKNGHITNLVLREGHVWSKKDVFIPVSAIEHVDDEAIHLKLDKHTIESFPAIPVKRR